MFKKIRRNVVKLKLFMVHLFVTENVVLGKYLDVLMYTDYIY